MKEKRKNKRYIINGMDVRCKIIFAAQVKLLNISFGGTSIRSDKKLNMGSRYTLTIDSEESKISLHGVVVREKIVDLVKNDFGETIPVYEVGIKFDNILTDKGNELIGFIQSNIVPKSVEVRLSGMRIDILEPEKTIIQGYQQNCVVNRISMGGVLIETEQPMEVDSKKRMELTIPEEHETLKFMGRVVSCLEVPKSSPKRFNTGIAFEEMDEKEEKRLKDFIQFLKEL